jgi:Cu(I)/Ag(I) efflux system membrane fusion protein
MRTMTTAVLFGAALTTVQAHADTKTFDQQMQPIVEQYLKIHASLHQDKTDGAQAAARKIAQLAPRLRPAKVTAGHAGHYQDLPEKLRSAAQALAKTDGLVATRAAFKELSKPIAMWAGMSKPAGLSVVYCSMAKGSWLQREPEVLNPYHGSEMLHCGEFVR